MKIFDFYQSIGDNNNLCSENTQEIESFSTITYTAFEKFTEDISFNIEVYLDINKDNCNSILVFIDSGIYLKACNITQKTNIVCQYTCKGKNFSKIFIKNTTGPKKICEIKLNFQDRLINVCI